MYSVLWDGQHNGMKDVQNDHKTGFLFLNWWEIWFIVTKIKLYLAG